MYLANYPFVIAFQLVLFTIPESPGLLKFGIVSSLHILCAYTACQFLIKPFPRISAALAIGLSMVMALDIQLKNIKGLRNMMNMVVADSFNKVEIINRHKNL